MNSLAEFSIRATGNDVQRLEALYRTAVAAAHPSHCLPPHLLKPPTDDGRLFVLAAGKGGGSLAEVAEGHYLAHLPANRF